MPRFPMMQPPLVQGSPDQQPNMQPQPQGFVKPPHDPRMGYDPRQMIARTLANQMPNSYQIPQFLMPPNG